MTNREAALDLLLHTDMAELDSQGRGFHQERELITIPVIAHRTNTWEVFEMLAAGYDLSEPYLNQLMHRFQEQRYKMLRNKLSIDVPVSGSSADPSDFQHLTIWQDSTRLYGVVDEYGILAADEVYINLPNRSGPLVQRVAVSRCV